METNFSRRGFLKGAGVTALGTAALGLAACSVPETPQAEPLGSTGEPQTTKNMPETWDFAADIIVIGSGGAGLAAGIAGCQSASSVILLEVSPEEECGGNTRVSGNIIMVPDSVEKGVTYQTNLNGGYIVDPDIVHAWSQGLVDNLPWLTDLGYEMVFAKFASPEFPSVEGGDGIKTYIVNPATGMKTWDALYEAAEDAGVEMHFDTRATDLVYDTLTNEVFGVIADGVSYKANKGVILACGGFENNPAMVRDYFPNTGCSQSFFFGCPYNVGDGFKMVMDIGADLWHMNAFAGGGVGLRIQSAESGLASLPAFKTKEFIYVDGEGNRFMYEETADHNRHGKVKERGVWPLITVPDNSHVILGQGLVDAGPVVDPTGFGIGWSNVHPSYIGATDNDAFMDLGILVKGDTIEELAEKLGYNPATLAATIEEYNADIAQGTDGKFHRGEEVLDDYFFDAGASSVGYGEGASQVSIEAFDLVPIKGPFYALDLSYGMLNSQGGPRKTVNGEVLDTKGNTIPRLYAAGEFGAPYPYMYNGGGNVSDAIASGRIAGTHCATLAKWDDTEA
ncbi:FAD-binding protein [Adlercreutzia muris]|uniref:FAD-binding protein n=1 Tax=Adlercreutzia muris TaxID=1796610 RepID=UPI00351652AA